MDYNAIAKVYFFLVCLHIHLFRLCIKKDSEKGVTFKIFYLPSQPDTHSAHAELKLFFLFKRESVETRTWEGEVSRHNIKAFTSVLSLTYRNLANSDVIQRARQR